MAQDTGIAGIGAVALVAAVTSALVIFATPLLTTIILAVLLAGVLFVLTAVVLRLRGHGIALRGLGQHSAPSGIEEDGGLAIDPRHVEPSRSQQLREDEARVLEMIAEDKNAKAVLEKVTNLLAAQYPGSRFRIVNDDLFDEARVDLTWPILPKTETEVGWVLQAVVRTGAEPEAEVVDLAVDLSRLAIDKARHRSTLRYQACLLYTSPSPRDRTRSRMPSSA